MASPVEKPPEPPNAPPGAPEPNEPNDPLAKLVRKAEDEVADKPLEQAIAYDAAGHEILRTVGDENGVELTPREQAGLVDAVVIHNHPPGQTRSGAAIHDIPPSVQDDLDVLLSCSPKEIRVVTQDYRFILKATPDPRYSDVSARLKVIRQQWTRSFNRLWKRRYDQLVKQYGEPLPPAIDLASSEGISEDAHRAWLEIAPKLGLSYRREKR